jgi:hypothetical protein
MRIKLDVYKRLIFEFISISFAVFLGLMLNQWKDDRNHKRLAKHSEINILAEITENKNIVQKMLEDHKLVLFKIDSVLALLDKIDEHGEIDLYLNFQLISSTSWETAKLTQAIVYMNIELVNEIAGVYDFQNYYESIVKDYVTNNIYNKPVKRDNDYLKRTSNFFHAIIPIENNLVEHYSYLQKEVLKQ